MNDLVSKLKNFDYKSFFLKHGEKIGLSVVIVFTLVALYQTAWGTINKSPEELAKLAKAAMNSLTTSPWPEDQKEQFVVGDLEKKARSLENQMNVAKLDFSAGRIFEPLYPRMQPAEEPKLSPVTNVIVDAGSMAIPTQAVTPASDVPGVPLAGQPAPGAPRKNDLAPFEDDPDLRANVPKDGLPVPPKPGDAAPAGEMNAAQTRRRRMMAGGDDDEQRPAGKPAKNAGKGGAAKGLDEGMAVAAQPAAPAIRGRGVRYASIRGVFPYEQQARQMAEALHISLARAAEQIEIDDFEIQRQRRIPGTDPWAGPWETLDYTTALDVLDEVTNYAPDVVRTEVTNNVITMALPERLTGLWNVSRVGHPQLQSYLLDEDSKREAEMKLNQEVLEQARQMGLKEQKQKRRPGRGFSSKQRDLGQLRRSLQNEAMNNPDVEDQMIRRQRMRKQESQGDMGNIPEPTRPGPANNRAGLTGLLGSDPFAIPKLILFRYFDFTVEPGECYRYRVRLVFLNPNYRKSLEKVVSAEVAQNETLKSEWSEPSPQVFIKADVNIFVTQVPRVRKTRGDGGILDVFEWDPQFGTMVRAQLKQYFGQSIGGPVKTDVLDPFSRTLGEREIVMRTRQIFVDSLTIPPLPLSENPDLQIDAKRFESLEKSGAFEQAVTVNHAGELVALVPLETTAERQKAIHDVETLNKNFAFMRAPKEDPNAMKSGGGGLEREMEAWGAKKNAGKGAAKGKNAKKGPQTNPLKYSGPNDGPGGTTPPGGRGRGGSGGGGGKNR